MISKKCECYKERESPDYSFTSRSGVKIVAFCSGTKERDECSCKGNRAKCDFYPEVREEATEEAKECRDKQELEFYRWWVTEHNLNLEAATVFEKWLKDIS